MNCESEFPSFVLKWLTEWRKYEKKKFVVKFCVIWIRKWYFRVPCWKVVSLKIYAECFLIMLSRTRFNGSVGWWNITVIYRKIVRVENILIKHFLATIGAIFSSSHRLQFPSDIFWHHHWTRKMKIAKDKWETVNRTKNRKRKKENFVQKSHYL